jgi:hypothetical protein
VQSTFGDDMDPELRTKALALLFGMPGSGYVVYWGLQVLRKKELASRFGVLEGSPAVALGVSAMALGAVIFILSIAIFLGVLK